MTPLLFLSVAALVGQPDATATALRTGSPELKVATLKLVADLAHDKFAQGNTKRREAAPDPLPYLPDVVACLTDPSEKVRYFACDALIKFRGEAAVAVPNLRKLLAEEKNPLRARAAVVVQRIGPPAKDAVPELIKCLDCKDSRDADPMTTVAGVVSSTSLALQAIGPEAKAAVPKLLEMLASDERDRQDNALLALGGIRSEQAKVLPEVLKVANDLKRDDDQRRLALRVVGELGTVNDEVLKLVLAALSEPLDDSGKVYPATHNTAIRAVGDLGPKVATDAILAQLVKLLDAKSVNREALIATFGKLGPKGWEALRAAGPGK